MLRRISEYIVDWQIRKSILTGNQRVVYLYAYEVFLNQVINILIAFFLAFIMRAPMQVLIFIASYIPLRSYCGGYHAETNGGCTIVSAFLIVLVCLAERAITGSLVFILLPVALLISGGLIFLFAPVSSKNKPLDGEEIARYRIRSRWIWLAEVVIGLAFCFIWIRVSTIIALSHILLSFMMVYGMLKKRV